MREPGGFDGRGEVRYAGQRSGVAMGQRAATGEHAVELAELLDADGALEVRHPVVEADLRIGLELNGGAAVTIETRECHPVLPQSTHALGQCGVARGNHAAFAGRDAVALMEAEARKHAAGPADSRVVVPGTHRAGGVFDEDDPAM